MQRQSSWKLARRLCSRELQRRNAEAAAEEAEAEAWEISEWRRWMISAATRHFETARENDASCLVCRMRLLVTRIVPPDIEFARNAWLVASRACRTRVAIVTEQQQGSRGRHCSLDLQRAQSDLSKTLELLSEQFDLSNFLVESGSAGFARGAPAVEAKRSSSAFSARSRSILARAASLCKNWATVRGCNRGSQREIEYQLRLILAFSF